jgi:hypothetical protein
MKGRNRAQHYGLYPSFGVSLPIKVVSNILDRTGMTEPSDVLGRPQNIVVFAFDSRKSKRMLMCHNQDPIAGSHFVCEQQVIFFLGY